MTQQATTTDELAFLKPSGEQEKQVLTAEAVEFLTELVTRFTPKRNKLLAARIQQQQDIDDGKLPDFISETASIRDGSWTIRGIPDDLQDRRVEITGPVERKMVINAMNANVKVFMADFEDSLAPDWNKVIEGQINLRDAVNGTISYTNDAGKIYQLKPDPAVLVCRVRGLHLPEKHVTWRGEAISRQPVRFRALLLPQLQSVVGERQRPVLLPAENAGLAGSCLVERRVLLCGRPL
ncbi:Malate synthase A [Kluyvera cryocrescens]|uniref:Malate synthase A n=1 Tax=Kluyvera cryocrescens TaxID=580 RepID=A0A485B680_KLUCR|nr:Malate synthase A [Kluyvera cryocrescens]